jgi:hypothetical protein
MTHLLYLYGTCARCQRIMCYVTGSLCGHDVAFCSHAKSRQNSTNSERVTSRAACVGMTLPCAATLNRVKTVQTKSAGKNMTTTTMTTTIQNGNRRSTVSTKRRRLSLETVDHRQNSTNTVVLEPKISFKV